MCLTDCTITSTFACKKRNNGKDPWHRDRAGVVSCCAHRYELLDEAMDHGYPQITDHTILSSLITQKGFKGDITDLALDLISKVWCHVCGMGCLVLTSPAGKIVLPVVANAKPHSFTNKITPTCTRKTAASYLAVTVCCEPGSTSLQ